MYLPSPFSPHPLIVAQQKKAHILSFSASNYAVRPDKCEYPTRKYAPFQAQQACPDARSLYHLRLNPRLLRRRQGLRTRPARRDHADVNRMVKKRSPFVNRAGVLGDLGSTSSSADAATSTATADTQTSSAAVATTSSTAAATTTSSTSAAGQTTTSSAATTSSATSSATSSTATTSVSPSLVVFKARDKLRRRY